MRFLALESGPVPTRVAFPEIDGNRPHSFEHDSLTGQDPARPPLPPPRGKPREILCREWL